MGEQEVLLAPPIIVWGAVPPPMNTHWPDFNYLSCITSDVW